MQMFCREGKFMFECFHRHRHEARRLTIIKVEKLMDIKFQVGGVLTETVLAVFKDAEGNVTNAHGAVVFTSSDETIATVVEGADGASAVVTGTGKVGTATITATDAADHASDIATVTTIAGEAVSLTLEEAPAPVVAEAVEAAPVEAAPASEPVPEAAAPAA
jgi:hypothetical protein